jgi:hypothetical protein
VITSATITIEADGASGPVNFIVQGDEGRALDIARNIMEKVVATQPQNFLGCKEHEVQ